MNFAPTRRRWRCRSMTSTGCSGDIKQGGGPDARKNAPDRGKLLPRDRIQRIGRSWIAVSRVLPPWPHKVYDDHIPAAGIITGIARIAGHASCVIVCNDATNKGRHLLSAHREEAPTRAGGGRREQTAMRLSGRFGGANLPNQDEVFPDPRSLPGADFLQSGANVGGGYSPRSRSSLGSCTAGGAYVPAMSDEASSCAIREPSSGRAAAGEGGDRRDRLGGRPGRGDLHARRSAWSITWPRTMRTRSTAAATSSLHSAVRSRSGWKS